MSDFQAWGLGAVVAFNIVASVVNFIYAVKNAENSRINLLNARWNADLAEAMVNVAGQRQGAARNIRHDAPCALDIQR